MARIPAAAALAALLVTSGWAAADHLTVPIGPLLETPLASVENALNALEGLTVPGGPGATPASPLLPPVFDLGRIIVQLLRAFAQATVLGAHDGDVGSNAGAPDALGVQAGERVVADGVRVPALNVTVPGRNVTIATITVNVSQPLPRLDVPSRTLLELHEERVPLGVPGIATRNVTLATPPIETPDVTASTPPVDVPPVVVRTPELNATTPPVHTPGARVVTPELKVPSQNASLDLSGASVELQRLRGTVYLGPLQVPYETPAACLGMCALPEAVPRRVSGSTPPVEVPSMELLDLPSGEALAPQTLRVPAQEVEVTRGFRVLDPREVSVPGAHVLDSQQVTVPGMRLFPGARLGELVIPAQRVATPALGAGGGQVGLQVPTQHVATLALDGARASTPGVEVMGERIALPAAGLVVPLPDPGPLGYFGYGQSNDSSLYPFVCTALVGCIAAKPRLEPWVERVDSTLDAVAARADGEVVVRV